MSFKKPLLIQNIAPKTIFVIFLWLMLAWILARPLKEVGKSVYFFLGSSVNNTYQFITNGKSLTDKLINAKKLAEVQGKEISLLKIKLNELKSENQKVENYKKLLWLKSGLSYKTIPVNVIGRSPDNWHRQIVLNKGENEGIKIGDTVISAKGVIGQIVETNQQASTVQLISDPAYRLGCRIRERNVLGIISPKSNSIGIIEFMPVGTEIKKGDIVETSGISPSGLAPSYPKGHPIGKIVKISRKNKKASDLYVEVKFFENLNSLSEVLVFSP